MKNLDSVLAHADANLDLSLQRLADFVRIPSISTDPQHAPDCVKAANWITSELKSIGFKAEARKTKGQPMVVAKHSPKSKSKVHALFYGHYDVQPVDPLHLWTTPPFEATRKQGGDGAVRIPFCSKEKKKADRRHSIHSSWPMPESCHATLPSSATQICGMPRHLP
jgi:acetylornithine deacetylase/succinyl-diaminopimelate desuccinylase-like protein